MSFIAYFDECGEEGFNILPPPQRGSSEWFILGAAISKSVAATPYIKALYAAFKETYRKQEAWRFHFVRASHDDRVGFIHHMTTAPYVCMAVAVHKPSLHLTEVFQRPYFLYFFTARLLLERISWYCRDHQIPGDEGDGRAALIFSSRRGLREADIREYLNILRARTEREDPFAVLKSHSIDWRFLNMDWIEVTPNETYVGLQMADAVASSAGKAFERSCYGFTEPRYLKRLRPLLYKSHGRYFRYGIKVFPRFTHELQAQERFRWVQDFR